MKVKLLNATPLKIAIKAIRKCYDSCGDNLGEKDLKITGLNRKIEEKIVKRYEKRGLFERGKYYE